MDFIRLMSTMLVFSVLIATDCSPQKRTTTLPAAKNSFVGSTPCDSLIKAIIGIPFEAKCEFIKWDLNLVRSTSDSGGFELSALYGESKPNTNGFMDGGKKISVIGKYAVQQGEKLSDKRLIYQLHAEQFKSPLFLVGMDTNILHFADAGKKFIVGNGGWGYVLNRINE